MLSWLANAWRVPELRRRLLYTAGILALYRLGSWIPVPGVDPNQIENYFRGQGGTVLDLLNIFSGGALSQFAVFALGIMPYITASIIMQLMTVVSPRLEQLQKEGEAGYARINQYTRYLTIALAAVQAAGYSYLFDRQEALTLDPGKFVLIVISLTAGTALLMWMGENITKRGVGNGISLLIFASILAGLPGGVRAWYETRAELVITAFTQSKEPAPPYRIGVSSWRRPADVSMPARIKSAANYQVARVARIEASRHGYDDAVLLNESGRVAEGTGSCVVCVREGAVVTPPASEGALESLTIDAVELVCNASGIRFERRPLERSELLVADEIALVGTITEISPVSEIDGAEKSVDGVLALVRRSYFDALRRRTKLPGLSFSTITASELDAIGRGVLTFRAAAAVGRASSRSA